MAELFLTWDEAQREDLPHYCVCCAVPATEWADWQICQSSHHMFSHRYTYVDVALPVCPQHRKLHWIPLYRVNIKKIEDDGLIINHVSPGFVQAVWDYRDDKEARYAQAPEPQNFASSPHSPYPDEYDYEPEQEYDYAEDYVPRQPSYGPQHGRPSYAPQYGPQPGHHPGQPRRGPSLPRRSYSPGSYEPHSAIWSVQKILLTIMGVLFLGPFALLVLVMLLVLIFTLAFA